MLEQFSQKFPITTEKSSKKEEQSGVCRLNQSTVAGNGEINQSKQLLKMN